MEISFIYLIIKLINDISMSSISMSSISGTNITDNITGNDIKKIKQFIWASVNADSLIKIEKIQQDIKYYIDTRNDLNKSLSLWPDWKFWFYRKLKFLDYFVNFLLDKFSLRIATK